MKTLSQKDMPPIDVIKQVPSEGRPKVVEDKTSSILYSTHTPYRPIQVMPSLIDNEEFHIELGNRSTGKGVNGIG